jgi:hypothetical protein
MYYEQLALEVGATVAGFHVAKPPILAGDSGVEHRFSFLAFDGERPYAFDVYDEVGQIELIRTYVKKMDTGANTVIVCLRGMPRDEAKELASFYGLAVLGPKEVGDFFNNIITAKIRSVERALPQV